MRKSGASLLLFLVAFACVLPSQCQERQNTSTMGLKLGHAWPELVGKTYAEAEAAIKKDAPNMTVSRVKPGSIVTMDHREDRVRVYVNDDDKVERPPRPG